MSCAGTPSHRKTMPRAKASNAARRRAGRGKAASGQVCNTRSGGGILASLPSEVIDESLSYLNGQSLAALEIATMKGPLVTDKHWEAPTRAAYDWIYPVKPKRFTWKRFFCLLRQASWPRVATEEACISTSSESSSSPLSPSSSSSSSSEEEEEEEDILRQLQNKKKQQDKIATTTTTLTDRVGGFYVIGGSNNRPLPLNTVEHFPDIGHAKVQSGGWPVPFQKPTKLNSLKTGRSAPAVTRDHDENIYVMGGWSGGHALASVERMSFTIPSLQEGADGYNRREQYTWEPFPSLTTGRCFLSACVDLQGRMYAFGGGNSVWQGSTVFKSTEILDPIRNVWKSGPDMIEPRCGLSSLVTARGDIYIAGGYGGGMSYLRSLEMLSSDGCRGWITTPSTAMRKARTGFGFAYGPDHCLYAIGGSPDGFHSHKSCERFDPRIGTWEKLPNMITARGYCNAAFGPSSLLYAAGGQSSVGPEDNMLMKTIEVFDPRLNRWRVIPQSESEGIARVDLALIFSLT